MSESNGGGGYINERMDRAEAMLNQVAADHVLFLQDHQMLLRAQVVMQDTLRELAVSQKATDDRLNALITVADGWIRGNSKSAERFSSNDRSGRATH